MGQGTRAYEGGGDAWARHYPGKGDLRGRVAGFGGDRLQRLECPSCDAVRLLSGLASYTLVTPPASAAPVGRAIANTSAAMGDLFRTAALTSLARALAGYQPISYNDSQAVCASAAALLDAEILLIADAGLDQSYLAMRALRAAVLANLIERGADLSRLTTVLSAAPTPALTLAYQLYRDAKRAGDLIARADAAAPLFHAGVF